MENKYPIIPKRKVDEDILFKRKAEEELLQRKQIMKEIKEQIRNRILRNDPAFMKTLKIFLSSSEENQNRKI